MYTFQDLFNEIDFQSEFVVVIYDEHRNQRYKMDLNLVLVRDTKVKYMYVEDGVLFIELNFSHYYTLCEDIGVCGSSYYLGEI